MASSRFHHNNPKFSRLRLLRCCAICSRHSLCHRWRRMLVLILLTCSLVLCSVFVSPESRCSQICPYQTRLSYNRLTFNNGDFVEHFSEFICPQNFRNLADRVYGWPPGVFGEKIESTTNESHIAPCLPPGSIIFVKTDYLPSFFRFVYPHLINRFVLITAQGDASAPFNSLPYLHEKDSKIIHWFAQNPDIHLPQTDRFTPIPIGINCYEMANGIRHIYRQHPNRTFPSLFGGEDEPRHYTHLLDITDRVLSGHFHQHILLLNFQRMTDPTGLRSHLWEMLCQHHLNSTFIACRDKPAGFHMSNLSAIHIRNRQYPLWLSPRGNGLDCHRTWEALYLDAIPIVWNSTLNPLFVDLPVIVISNWTELTEPYLRLKLNEIAVRKMSSPSIYRWEKLRFSYWRRMILSKSRHPVTATRRENLCWHAKLVHRSTI